MRRASLGLILGWLVLFGSWADAQTGLIPPPPGHVKVTVEFRQAGQTTQGGVELKGTGPGGPVIQVDPKGVTGSARVQVQEAQRTVRRSVGSFLPNKRIRLRVTPQISYRSDQGDGTIELVETSTEVVVQSGQPVTIGGTEGSAEVMRQFCIVLTAEAS